MKKIYQVLCGITALLCAANVNAQDVMDGGEYFRNTTAEKQGGSIVIKTTMDLDHLEMNTRKMALITPVLRSADEAHSYSFSPVLVEGRTRRKATERAELLNGFKFENTPVSTLVYTRSGERSIPMEMEAPYQPWMRNTALTFDEHITGCRSLTEADRNYLAMQRILPPLPVPEFNVAYATPPAEAVKQRSESYKARLNFHVNRYDIIRSYMNNAAELDEVDRILKKIGRDPYLTINEIIVTGYASPEGSAQGNMTLSENRARSFVDYIRRSHQIPADILSARGMGDDWNGLVELMRNSTFGNRDRVIDIVTNQSNVQTRKNELKAMGTAYRTLLDEYYPQLRRNEYTVNYVARPFSIEEMKEVIKTNPEYLSAAEMYQLAISYPKGSKEYIDVFGVAVRTYPKSESAQMNIAAIDIENGRFDDAAQRLQGIELPEAWNNLGYIYAQKKDYDLAAEYFRRAAQAGNPVAKVNLARIEEWKNNL